MTAVAVVQTGTANTASVVAALRRLGATPNLVNDPGDWGNTYAPLLHADWHGWTPTDLVFPFFLFAVGVAIPFALSRRLEAAGGDHGPLYRQIVRRTLILLALGLFLN